MIEDHGNYIVVSVPTKEAKLYINWCNINVYGEWMYLETSDEYYIMFQATDDYQTFLDHFRDKFK